MYVLCVPLEQMLCTHRIATKDQRWHTYLADIEMAINFSGKAFYLCRLRDPHFPFDVALFGLDALRVRLGTTPGEWAIREGSRVADVWNSHHEVTRAHAVSTAARLNKGRDLPLTYKPGDRVLLLRHNRTRKWDLPYYDEPYRVLRVDDYGNCQLGDLHYHPPSGGRQARSSRSSLDSSRTGPVLPGRPVVSSDAPSSSQDRSRLPRPSCTSTSTTTSLLSSQGRRRSYFFLLTPSTLERRRSGVVSLLTLTLVLTRSPTQSSTASGSELHSAPVTYSSCPNTGSTG